MTEPGRLAVEAALLAVALLPAGAGLYLGVLALLSMRPRAPTPGAPHLRFAVVVPAHDESAGIGQTVHSLLSLDYPAALRRVLVVADNCSDDTAAQARAAGAEVLERTDTQRRGKGYALACAFEALLAEGTADAVVVIDADTVVSPNLLNAFSARLEAGARVAQAHYGVQNPEASWRTRLMRIALSMFHQVRSIARERLSVSAGLRGNGMCFSLSVLREVPHDAYSLVEDLEYGVKLGRAGHRVVYVHEADVRGEMVSGEQASRSQRTRWEQGRAQMRALYGWPLIREGVRRRSALLIDLALDVLVPPLSQLVVALGLLTAAAFGLVAVTGVGAWALSAGALGLSSVGLYVLAGWAHSGTGARGLLDLALAPVYVVWKLRLRLKGAGQKQAEWVRTTREGEPRS